MHFVTPVSDRLLTLAALNLEIGQDRCRISSGFLDGL